MKKKDQNEKQTYSRNFQEIIGKVKTETGKIWCLYDAYQNIKSIKLWVGRLDPCFPLPSKKKVEWEFLILKPQMCKGSVLNFSSHFKWI